MFLKTGYLWQRWMVFLRIRRSFDSGGSMKNWLLVDTISLREMLDALGMSHQMADGDQLPLFDTSQMGDNLQLVFLKMGQCAL